MVTCQGCGLKWTSLSQAHCSGCHRQFGGEESFASHRDRGFCVLDWHGGTVEADGVFYSGAEHSTMMRLKTARERKR